MIAGLIGLVLSCQMKYMMPDFYKAEVKFVDNKKVSLKLENLYYGASLKSDYSLIKNEKGFEGKDKQGRDLLLHSISKTQSGYALFLNGAGVGNIEMNCSLKK